MDVDAITINCYSALELRETSRKTWRKTGLKAEGVGKKERGAQEATEESVQKQSQLQH